MYNWDEIVACIKEHDDIVIMTHTNMDGDAMGSASALCHALRHMGKRAVVLLEDAVPGYLNVIHRYDGEEGFGPIFVGSMSFKPQLAIAVDCSSESRITNRLDVYKAADKRICIDHHLGYDSFADYALVDPDVAATGILIYEAIKALGVSIDTHIAEDLYVAIITDTGRFKYSNTTAEVHRVVAELYGYGIDHVKLCNAIYDSYPVSQLKAEALAMDKMELFANNKAVISSITQDEMKYVGASYDQIDTCIDRIRIVEGVEIAAFIKEREPNLYKVSLRSKTYSDVNRVAEALGGGGHEKAAGATLIMSLDEAIKQLKIEIEKELARYQ